MLAHDSLFQQRRVNLSVNGNWLLKRERWVGIPFLMMLGCFETSFSRHVRRCGMCKRKEAVTTGDFTGTHHPTVAPSFSRVGLSGSLPPGFVLAETEGWHLGRSMFRLTLPLSTIFTKFVQTFLLDIAESQQLVTIKRLRSNASGADGFAKLDLSNMSYSAYLLLLMRSSEDNVLGRSMQFLEGLVRLIESRVHQTQANIELAVANGYFSGLATDLVAAFNHIQFLLAEHLAYQIRSHRPGGHFPASVGGCAELGLASVDGMTAMKAVGWE